jgi:hypothetical protein
LSSPRKGKMVVAALILTASMAQRWPGWTNGQEGEVRVLEVARKGKRGGWEKEREATVCALFKGVQQWWGTGRWREPRGSKGTRGIQRPRGGDSEVARGWQEPGRDGIKRAVRACTTGTETAEAGSLTSGSERHNNGWRR